MEKVGCERESKRECMSKVGAEIIETEETQENGVKYLNINVSNSEVERNPDIVRLCSDVGILEYMKPKTGHWIDAKVGRLFPSNDFKCSECGNILDFNGVNCGRGDANFCPNCGAKMVDPQEGDDIE